MSDRFLALIFRHPFAKSECLWTLAVAAKPRITFLAAILFGCAAPAFATDPLSAIEWLEKRPKQIVVPLETLNPPKVDEPAVAGSVVTPEVTVTPLGAPVRAAAGLLPSSVTGLPRTLWFGSEAEVLTALFDALNVEAQPALQSLLFTLVLAEADPPQDARVSSLMRARIEKLLHLGALDPAQLEGTDPKDFVIVSQPASPVKPGGCCGTS